MNTAFDPSKEIAELVHECLAYIHEDIFERAPRGQIVEGQEVTWHRCAWLLQFKDDVNSVLDKMEEEGYE